MIELICFLTIWIVGFIAALSVIRIFNDLPDTLVLKGKGKVIWGVGELYGFEWKDT